MKLIVGLGNPGDKYENTRHNAGFLFLDYFHDQNNDFLSGWKVKKQSNSMVSEGKIGDQKIVLAKPQTFMNDSGRSTQSLAACYQPAPWDPDFTSGDSSELPAADLIVIHDDIDLKFGKYKIQTNRGAAGHKGVESIVEYMNTNAFTRVRIGIFPENLEAKKQVDTHSFVLKKFAKVELANLYSVVFPKIIKELSLQH